MGLHTIAAEKESGVMLKELLRHFHPELTHTEIYKMLVQRTLDDDIMSDIMRNDNLREQLDSKGREKLEKQLEARKKEKHAEKKSFSDAWSH